MTSCIMFRLDAGRSLTAQKPLPDKNLPPPIRPSAKQIGLFLTLSSTLRKAGGKADLVKSISLQKQKVSFLSEEISDQNLEEMRTFYNRPELTGKCNPDPYNRPRVAGLQIITRATLMIEIVRLKNCVLDSQVV